MEIVYQIVILLLALFAFLLGGVLCVVTPKLIDALKAIAALETTTTATVETTYKTSEETLAAAEAAAKAEDEAAAQAAVEKLTKLRSAATTLGITVTDDMDAAAILAAINEVGAA